MIPWLKNLLWDQTAFIRYTRAGLLFITGLFLDGSLPWPASIPRGVLAAIMGFAGFLGAGEKNRPPAEVKILAKEAEGQSLEDIHAEAKAQTGGTAVKP